MNGRQFGHDPRLKPGQLVALSIPGFAPNSTVHEQIACTNALSTDVMADRRGVVSAHVRVPDGLSCGPHVLTFTGTPPATVRTLGGTVLVSVPQTAFFRFTVIGSPTPATTCR